LDGLTIAIFICGTKGYDTLKGKIIWQELRNYIKVEGSRSLLQVNGKLEPVASEGRTRIVG
jgi:hypothetical protein